LLQLFLLQIDLEMQGTQDLAQLPLQDQTEVAEKPEEQLPLKLEGQLPPLVQRTTMLEDA